MCRRTLYRDVLAALQKSSEHEVHFAGTAIGLLCICSLLEAVDLDSALEPRRLQLSSAIGVMTVSPHSSACSAWLPDLMKVKVWRGSGSRCQSDITVVTQLSVDRWPYTVMQLHSLSTSFTSPLRSLLTWILSHACRASACSNHYLHLLVAVHNTCLPLHSVTRRP